MFYSMTNVQLIFGDIISFICYTVAESSIITDGEDAEIQYSKDSSSNIIHFKADTYGNQESSYATVELDADYDIKNGIINIELHDFGYHILYSVTEII